jgi:hypothetical protein
MGRKAMDDHVESVAPRDERPRRPAVPEERRCWAPHESIGLSRNPKKEEPSTELLPLIAKEVSYPHFRGSRNILSQNGER